MIFEKSGGAVDWLIVGLATPARNTSTPVTTWAF
mgnify:CR=1 FL=1